MVQNQPCNLLRSRELSTAWCNTRLHLNVPLWLPGRQMPHQMWGRPAIHKSVQCPQDLPGAAVLLLENMYEQLTKKRQVVGVWDGK